MKSIEPTTKRKAPATFHFKAGPAEGDKGEMPFKSVSKRHRWR